MRAPPDWVGAGEVFEFASESGRLARNPRRLGNPGLLPGSAAYLVSSPRFLPVSPPHPLNPWRRNGIFSSTVAAPSLQDPVTRNPFGNSPLRSTQILSSGLARICVAAPSQNPGTTPKSVALHFLFRGIVRIFALSLTHTRLCQNIHTGTYPKSSITLYK